MRLLRVCLFALAGIVLLACEPPIGPDETAPSVQIVSEDTVWTREARTSVTVRARDDRGVDSIDIRLNGVPVQTARTSGKEATVTLSLDLPEDVNRYWVVAHDGSANADTALLVVVSDRTPPTIVPRNPVTAGSDSGLVLVLVTDLFRQTQFGALGHVALRVNGGAEQASVPLSGATAGVVMRARGLVPGPNQVHVVLYDYVGNRAESTPLTLLRTEPVIAVATGGNHACALDRNGRALCWGADDLGQLGDGGAAQSRAVPAYVTGAATFRSLDAGHRATCGTTADAEAWCWGELVMLSFGSTPRPLGTIPARLEGAAGTARVDFGTLCRLDAAGTARCTGDNSSGAAGDGSATLEHAGWVQVAGGHAFSALSLSWSHGCGLAVDGQAWCWGNNSRTQLGDGTDVQRRTPVAVSGDVRFANLFTGAETSCGLTADGALYCWGWTAFGRLPYASPTSVVTTPRRMADGLQFTRVSPGIRHGCGLTTAGDVWCWGGNQSGQLGALFAFTGPQYTFDPVHALPGLKFRDMDVNGDYTCGVTTTGDVLCWGALPPM
jgi:alpha-tubulin suppressor-like RCC1 family protein